MKPIYNRAPVERTVRLGDKMFDNGVICKNCGQEAWRESCDVGIGVIYGPYGCPCGWSEDERYNLLDGKKITDKGGILDQWGGLTPNAN